MLRNRFMEADLPFPDTLVVFDLEFTTWEGYMASGWSLPGKHREIVQIGAVRLDAGEGFAETGAFRALVRPRLHPELSSYFTDLTGISQETVNRDGRPFPEVMGDFADFLAATGPVLAACNGIDGEIIAENCGWHRLDIPEACRRTLNLAKMLANLFEEDGQVSSHGLPARLGLPEVGVAHDALADARAIAAALRHFRVLGRL
jgi:inhibitor of KinA sporulation pathway (predicted exonuclease)